MEVGEVVISSVILCELDMRLDSLPNNWGKTVRRVDDNLLVSETSLFLLDTFFERTSKSSESSTLDCCLSLLTKDLF